MLPEFTIIGAAKSGTTWLTHCLHEHPEVFIPTTEIHYYSWYFEEKTKEWYEAHFAQSSYNQIIGENSNTYVVDPRAATRIREAIPNAKLICLLRNPVERAYSGYCMQLNRGAVSKDIASYLDPDRTPRPGIIKIGLYYGNLSRFFTIFPREQIKVLLYDDVASQPKEVFQSVCEFIGARTDFEPPSLHRRHNAKETHGIPPAYKRFIWPWLRSEPVRIQILRRVQNNALWRFTEGLASRQLKYPELTPCLRQKLKTYYAKDVSQLSDLLGRDLSQWLK